MSKDLREFIECFNEAKVDFLVVGALAVARHGFQRYSMDLDFLVRPSEENAQRVLAALQTFGFGALDIEVADFLRPDWVVQLGHEPNRIDLMTSISGVGFDEAWDGRVAGELDGIAVNYLGLDALLRNKAATGRPKDLIDLYALQQLQKPED